MSKKKKKKKRIKEDDGSEGQKEKGGTEAKKRQRAERGCLNKKRIKNNIPAGLEFPFAAGAGAGRRTKGWVEWMKADSGTAGQLDSQTGQQPTPPAPHHVMVTISYRIMAYSPSLLYA
jgi:hypothetical protein